MTPSEPANPLGLFLPPVEAWFRETLGRPTPAQALGWPQIAAGRNTLLLAPTGSGKTLAAFLAGLDRLWRQKRRRSGPDGRVPRHAGAGRRRSGVQILYVSPLKALNHDIHRNLRLPLEGIIERARAMGQPLPAIRAGLRTGDSTGPERQALVRHPPDVLITTPESLHLMLTSRARETLRSVQYVIVDEIHALSTNKRGVFLALLLERLEAGRQAAVPDAPEMVRIGLSATQRPLEEVARFLGGRSRRRPPESGSAWEYHDRPVAIVDAGARKDLDLEVIGPAAGFSHLPDHSVWPAVDRTLLDLIERHRSTIVFANNRRTVERITAHLNALADSREASPSPGDHPPAPIARAHHGSVAHEVRLQTEAALKEGRLPAVVATASLELGIDMTAVDLVCQVESPGSVSRGLQRVGRAGHLVGGQTKGRLIPKHAGDLLEQAVLARAMAAGQVEAIRVPTNCLDVLAQQVVAMVALEPWSPHDLYATLRQAFPYRDLSPQAFESVLAMVAGRDPVAALRDLPPRVSWDRIHNLLRPLPGSQRLAVVNGGAIPDTGQYAVMLQDAEVRLGELDEEFVFERRVGDTFVLGTNAWRIEAIEADRVVVSRAAGAPAMMPFWRGENAARSYELSQAIGALSRELAGRLDDPACLDWLRRDYLLDRAAARALRDHIGRQVRSGSRVPDDRTIVIEQFHDAVGDRHVAVLTAFGARLHLPLRLAIVARLQQRLGMEAACLHDNDGILIRLPDQAAPPLDLFDGITAETVEPLVIEALRDTALFGLRFRQAAARALLLPRQHPGKRSPLWLQRLKAKDLLQVVRDRRDFPIVLEAYRECLEDDLDLPRLKQVLADVAAGRIEVAARQVATPSPFVAGLLLRFVMVFMYESDRPASAAGREPAALDCDLLDQLLAPAAHAHLLDPRAITQVERRVRGVGCPPRSPDEMAEWLRRVGDVGVEECEGPMLRWLEALEADGRVRAVALGTDAHRLAAPKRWILAEEVALYDAAFNPEPEGDESDAALRTILRRFLRSHALVSLDDVLRRYPVDADRAWTILTEWDRDGSAVALASDGLPVQWADGENLEQIRRGSLAVLRREAVACRPEAFADFVLRRQYLHPETRRAGPAAVDAVLGLLQGLPVPAELWEEEVLPRRIINCPARPLDAALSTGAWLWIAGGTASGPGRGPRLGPVAFLDRELAAEWPRGTEAAADAAPGVGPAAADLAAVREYLDRRGASFVADIACGTGIAPSRVRAALWTLARRGAVSNDGFDVVRRGEPQLTTSLEGRGPGDEGRRPGLRSMRRLGAARPEGRWQAVSAPAAPPEVQAVHQARALLRRYGVVSRELAALDPWSVPWRVLYEVYSRLELAGEIRRGYFVEGLSGGQFAEPETVNELARVAAAPAGQPPAILVHSTDPANLYGSGAPLDIPLLDGGTARLGRGAGNSLVLVAGRPVLVIEDRGKRLTALPGASAAEVQRALGRLGDLAGSIIRVEQWNGQPVTTTPGAEWLARAGFVPDYRAMTLYGGWPG